jgi:manganese transport protein
MFTDAPRSLGEIHGSVPTAATTSWKRLLAFGGPAYLISVGYMDPGNWATDLEGGARFGYQLLWVLVLSNLMAILLQTLSARLGIVARRDLAQACREAYPRPVAGILWILCEVAIAACDLAEILGAAIALQLLFKLPLLWGVLLTAVDTFFILFLLQLGVKRFESIIRWIIGAIGLCFIVELWLAKPLFSEVVTGLVPTLTPESLYVAVAILGATVMPHNLYLHSALVQTRDIDDSPAAKRQACRYNFFDSAIALNAALFINVAILVLSAAVFFKQGVVVTEIQQAHVMLAPLLGTATASILFAVALLLAGQSSTLTGTLAGQVVMEGFLNIRMQPWIRRAVTRGVAIVPAVVTIVFFGEGQVYQLLIFSQVVLSLQLPFAVVPLVRFTSDRTRMGEFVSPLWLKALAFLVSSVIIGLNCWLVSHYIDGWLLLPAIGLGGLLAYLLVEPFLAARRLAATTVMPVEPLPSLDIPRYERILVPLDHSAKDAIALRHAAAFALQHDARLLLVHVEDGATSRVYGEMSSTAEVKAGRDYLASVLQALERQSVKAELLIYHSNRAADEIIRAARQYNADLIVMGSHGHGRLGDLIYGETIERVRHSVPIPLLVVK